MTLFNASKQILARYKFIALPALSVVLGGFLFRYFPFHFVPDWFGIHESAKIYELFNLIISSLVALISFYISVSLVAYESFKQKSGIDFHKSFLVNGVNASFISISVATIVVAFLSSILVSNTNPTEGEVSIIYYNIFLFIFVIVSLFVVAFNLFSSLKPEKIAQEELDKINKDTISIKYSKYSAIDEEAMLFEEDHLVKIENIVIALIAVSENIKAQVIIQKVTLKLSNIIIDENTPSNRKDTIERLISFYIRIIDFSLLQPNNSIILRSIWSAIGNMYGVVIERKETVVIFKSFHKEFFERYFNRLFENNKEEIIFEGITMLKEIIYNQIIFNTVDEKEIYYFNNLRKSIEKNFDGEVNYTDEDFKNAGQWNEVAVELMGSFHFIINKAIKFNNSEVLNKCFEQINKLNFILRLEETGIYKQTFLYISSASIICDYTYRAFKYNVFIEGSDAEHLTPSLFENLIEGKHPAARTILQKYCHLLVDLQEINKLDRWFLGGLTINGFITTLGDLGRISKTCALNLKKGKEIHDCLEDCISTFSILKEEYEKKLPDNYHLYSTIKWQFKNILEWIGERNEENQLIVAKLKELIVSFKEPINSGG